MKKALAYILPTLLCFVLGGIAGVLQNDAIAHWYPYLNKSALTPPNIAFPIAWGIIYLCMGISAGLVLTSRAVARSRVMWIWFVQLALNFLWSVLFFFARNPLAGMIDIVALDILVIYYMAHAYRVRRAASWLFLPYLLWILFATYLNGYLLFCN